MTSEELKKWEEEHDWADIQPDVVHNICNKIWNQLNGDSIMPDKYPDYLMKHINLDTKVIFFDLIAIYDRIQYLSSIAGFRGYYGSLAELAYIRNPVAGDFAWLAEIVPPSTTANEWTYDGEFSVWVDTGREIPNKGSVILMGTQNPLMDGAPTPGNNPDYTPIDHRHPTDITRAAKIDLDNLVTAFNTHVNTINIYMGTHGVLTTEFTAFKNNFETYISNHATTDTEVGVIRTDISNMKLNIGDLKTGASALDTAFTTHKNDKGNPHAVTAAQAGAIKSGGSMEAGLFRYSNSTNTLNAVTVNDACVNLGLGGSTNIMKLREYGGFTDVRKIGTAYDKTPNDYVTDYELNSLILGGSTGEYREFINGSFIGLPTPSYYLVKTMKGWSDYNDGRVVQVAYGCSRISGGMEYTRYSPDANTWSPWKLVTLHSTGASIHSTTTNYRDWPVGDSGLVIRPRERWIQLIGKASWNGSLTIVYGVLGNSAWTNTAAAKIVSMWINGNGSFETTTPIGTSEYWHSLDLTIGDINSEMWHIKGMVTGMSAYTFDAVRII